jgi:hypothetical protein
MRLLICFYKLLHDLTLSDVITVFTFVSPRELSKSWCRIRTTMCQKVRKPVFWTFYAHAQTARDKQVHGQYKWRYWQSHDRMAHASAKVNCLLPSPSSDGKGVRMLLSWLLEQITEKFNLTSFHPTSRTTCNPRSTKPAREHKITIAKEGSFPALNSGQFHLLTTIRSD